MSLLLEQASQAAKQAATLDREGKHTEAINYYIRAAELLQQYIKFCRNPHERKMFYDRALEYIARAKQLQEQIGKSKKSSVAAGKKGTAADEEDDEISKKISDAIVAEKPNVEWEDVANLEEAKAALREAVILPMRRPDLFKGARKPWRGILLFGPPGCGKTYLAKAVATAADATFFSISAADLISKWMGESEKLVKELYRQAEKYAPSIIFFDEVDALTGARGEGEHEAMRRVKTQLLQAIQGVTSDEEKPVVTLGATNTPWDIDAAMRRRFERRIYITLPDTKARKLIFEIHTRGVKLSSDVDFDELARYTAGYSAADISLICRDALMNPIRELDPEELLNNPDLKPRDPARKDFLAAIQRIKPSVAPEELRRYEEWKAKFGS